MSETFWTVVLVGYVLSLIKWFNADHYYFWDGFKELIWALIPIINITYVWEEFVGGIFWVWAIVWGVANIVFYSFAAWFS